MANTDSPWTEKIFSNPVIFDVLSTYLRLRDIKTLRLTCSTLNNEVLKSVQFRNISILVIGKNSIDAGILRKSRGKFYIVKYFRNFRLEITKGLVERAEEVTLLWNLLATYAEYVDFAGGFARTYPCNSLSTLLFEDVQNVPLPLSLEQGVSASEPPLRDYKYILNSNLFTEEIKRIQTFNNLKKLRMHKEFLDDLSFADCAPLMDNLFKCLKELIFEGDFKYSVLSPETFNSNLKFITERCTNLTKLTIKTLFYKSDSPQLDTFLESVDAIIRTNKNTLEQLFLDDSCVWKLECLGELTFPKLKECNLRCWEDAESISLSFFNNHPSIENLDAKLFFAYHLNTQNAIIGPKRIEYLKKLSLMSRGFLVKDIMVDPKRNPWGYLKEMKSLQEVQITQLTIRNKRFGPAFCSLGLPAQVLYNLSANVKKVDLTGMNGRNVDASEFELLTQPDIHRRNNSFLCFDNLVELSFSNCALTEENVQFVLARMRRMRKLEFHECEGLTDFALSGVKAEDQGNHIAPTADTFSLNGLCDLITLKITFCNGITNNLLTHIDHNLLTNLDLGGNEDMHITKEPLSALVLRNSSLLWLFLRTGDVKEIPGNEADTKMIAGHTLHKFKDLVAALSEERCCLLFYSDFN